MATYRHCALAMLAAIIAAPAAGGSSSDVESLISNLDLTSFPNSTGPHRMAGEFTFADYGFTRIEKMEAGAKLTARDGGWTMSFEIVSGSQNVLEICFHDRALRTTDQVFRPSYNATSALRVIKSPRGRWSAEQIKSGFPDCRNDPPSV